MTPAISPALPGPVPCCAPKPPKRLRRRPISGDTLTLERWKLKLGPYCWALKQTCAEDGLEMTWDGTARSAIWRCEDRLKKHGRIVDVTGAELDSVPELSEARAVIAAQIEYKPSTVIQIMVRHRNLPAGVKAWAIRRSAVMLASPRRRPQKQLTLPFSARPGSAKAPPIAPIPSDTRSTDAAPLVAWRSMVDAPSAAPMVREGAAPMLRPSYKVNSEPNELTSKETGEPSRGNEGLSPLGEDGNSAVTPREGAQVVPGGFAKHAVEGYDQLASKATRPRLQARERPTTQAIMARLFATISNDEPATSTPTPALRPQANPPRTAIVKPKQPVHVEDVGRVAELAERSRRFDHEPPDAEQCRRFATDLAETFREKDLPTTVAKWTGILQLPNFTFGWLATKIEQANVGPHLVKGRKDGVDNPCGFLNGFLFDQLAKAKRRPGA